MRVAYFDCFSGISGDMTVGALIDAGASFDSIRDTLDLLGVKGYTLAADKVGKNGVTATKFRVKLDKNMKHPQRNLVTIRDLLDKAPLPEPVRANAKAIFEIIGHAEAEVHGTTIERVHFHEVGAVDSIVDVVGACMGMHLLGIDEVYASNVHVGAGTIRCAHGVMPVPAPATARILAGIPTYGGEVQGELTTPTGAAILKHFSRGFGQAPLMRVDAIGYGAGDKGIPDRANVVRVQVGELEEAGSNTQDETITVIEANIDDMPGELVPPLMEALLAAGARDAFYTPAQGKKGRPVCVVTALCDAAAADQIAGVFFANSTTIGVRIRDERRIVLPRVMKRVTTPWGVVAVKVSGVSAPQSAPEFEDCKAVAHAANVPVKQVYEAALAAAVRGEWIDE